MRSQRTPSATPRSPRAGQLAGALLLIAVAAHPAAAVTGLAETTGKAVTTFTGCKRSARALTLPVRFLSDSQWQTSLGAVTPSGTYAASTTRRVTTIPFVLDDASRTGLLAELQARTTTACGHAIALGSLTVRTFRGKINARRAKVTVKLVVALAGTGSRQRGAFRFTGRGTLGPLPTTTTTTSTSTSTTTSTVPPCTEFNVAGCPVTSEGERIDERNNDDPQSAVPVAIGTRIEGTIGNLTEAGPDHDYFTFNAVAGDHLKVAISNRDGGTFQAIGAILLVRDDVPPGAAYRIIRPGTSDTSLATREFSVLQSGEYALLVSDVRNDPISSSAPNDAGGPTFTYRAELSRVVRAPIPVTPPIVEQAGSVPGTGDIALFSFAATMGDEIIASTRATQLPTPSKVDTVLLLFDVSTTPPTPVAYSDDQDEDQTDAAIDTTAPKSGAYVLVVDHYDVGGITPDDRKWNVSLSRERCAPDATRSCYGGAPGTAGVGPCRAGTQTCLPTGAFGPCAGEVLPQPETCNGVDDDCNGPVDDACVFSEREGLDERTNDNPQRAVPVSIGVPIEGTIGNLDQDNPDLDLFKFDATAGDHLRVTISNRAGGAFEAFGRVATSTSAVFDRNIRPGTSDRSTATREFVIRESGEHLLVVGDLRNRDTSSPVGGSTLTYRAEISRVIRDPIRVTPPLVDQPGNVPDTGDVVVFAFEASAGDALTASTRAEHLPTPSTVDTYLLLFDASTIPPTLVTFNDDSDGVDSLIEATAPTTGPYLLVVDHFTVAGILPDERTWDVSLGIGPPCANQVRNGDETDVDCGGSSCAACGLTKTCTLDRDCASQQCTDGRCRCPTALITFSVTSSVAGLFDTAQWPGGTQVYAPTPECRVRIVNPTGGIGPFSNGSPFAVAEVAGFATCFGTGGEDGDGCEPVSCPPLGLGSCSASRPTCSIGNNGSGSARFRVQCEGNGFEPNETAADAAPAPAGETPNLTLTANDTDWFQVTVPAGTLTTVGVTFPSPDDLDLSAHRSDGACLGGRVPPDCQWTTRRYETNEEFLSVVNPGSSDIVRKWRVTGQAAATHRYTLTVGSVPWRDGASCTALFGAADCEGPPGGTPALLQFPLADAADAYVGDGYRLETPANYRWVRRETAMLVRYAIRHTQQPFPGTKALGLADMSQRDGVTPADDGGPRHADGTHQQGRDIDVAYFTTLAAAGTIPYNQFRAICDANGTSNDGFFCNASASTTHVVDLPRQVYFLAQLVDSPRVRVVGVDQVIAPLLVAEAERQRALGWISATQLAQFRSKLGFGAERGWQFQFRMIHVSLR